MKDYAVEVEPAHLGQDASTEDAVKMAKILRKRGYDAVHVEYEGDTSIVPDEVWDECLEELVNQKE